MVKTMAKIQVLQDPGFLYDLNFIFYLKFNMEAFIEDIADKSKKEENTAYFKGIIAEFGEISDDLYVFYHANQSGRCFMTTHYLKPYAELFTSSFDFKFMQKELSDHEKLMRNMIRFYLPNIPENEIEECVDSSSKIFPYIKNSKYSREEKSRLYEFFMDPTPYVQALHYELIEKNLLLTDYYKNNYKKIIEANNQTDFKTICNQMQGVEDLSFLDKDNQTLYLSYCLLNKYLINNFILNDGIIALLGYDYVSILTPLKNGLSTPKLENFGSALCDENRINILKLIVDRGEVTCKDLEKEFNFSGSTAYHHITIMTRSGIVKTRNEGKTIYYGINKKHIINIVNAINKFFNL